jgi:predicted DNA-binding transcriptional regulator AlpA
MSAVTPAPPPIAPADVEPSWTVEDVMRYLHIGRSTALLWVQSGRLPRPTKIGKRFLWAPATIRALVEGK